MTSPKPPSLTRSQRKLYEWLKAHPNRSYTVAQIARYVNLSPGVAEKHLDVLASEDLIHEEPVT